ncbi:MucBP domain-containing protein [Fructilactobacillus vespulae]|uniref:MucBP domain-containing protein n=1 Tax=Fructilactobacillus vespulae TaxID=1249630 RepID=UPI0039B48A75
MKKALVKIFIAIFTVGMGVGIASNVQANQSDVPEQTKGTITVRYENEIGQTIRPATVNTGSSGVTFTAQIPTIDGYSLARIENGQNDANGPRMVFGGTTPADANQEMVIVYNSVPGTSAAADVQKQVQNQADATKNPSAANKQKSDDSQKSANQTASTKKERENKNNPATSTKTKSTEKQPDTTKEQNGDGALLYGGIAIVVIVAVLVFIGIKLRKK